MLAFLLFLFPMENGLGSCQIEYDAWPASVNMQELVFCVTNAAPDDCLIADAGADKIAFTQSIIALNGGATSTPHTPEAISYQWTQVDNGAPLVTLNNSDIQTPTFTTDSIGIYEFRLDAAWLCRTDTAFVEIEVQQFSGVPSELNAVLITTEPNDTIVQVTYASPGDDRLFIVYKSGEIRIFKDGAVLPAPFLNISHLMSTGSEQGLLGLAFDPDYETNGFFYLNYTGQNPDGTGLTRDTRIVAWQRDAINPDLADPDANQVLLSLEQPFSNHNGGQLLFGPDGYLYIGTGDGGSAGDPGNRAQNPQELLGKMLRIEVDGFSPYTIPADNPFVGDPGVLDEIWALGLRNPWRFSFDRLTGDLYIGDVGQNIWEEINFQPASSIGGENYGWRLKEGDSCFNPPTNCDPGGLTDPVFVYQHGPHCSITGGFVYRGANVPQLSGFYLLGDFCSGQYWTLRDTGGGNWEDNTLTIFVNDSALTSSDNITAFGEDSDGEIYAITRRSGAASVYKITSVRN